MTSTFLRLFVLCIGTMGLQGCGSDQSNPAISLKNAVFAKVATAGDPSPKTNVGPNTLTRAELTNIGQPVKRVTVESSGAQALVIKIATNRDVETWSSTDNRVLSMRNGVVVATRGFGEDLMSAVVPQLTQVSNPGRPHQRRHIVLDGEDKPTSLYFACRTSPKGPTTITMVERDYAAHHIIESCSGSSGKFSNEFWLESGGTLRRSRQWISESVGFVLIEHL